MSNREILLIGHGSRVPKAVEEFVSFAKALSKHINQPVNHCFLELAEPEMMHGLHGAAKLAGKGGELLILPMFLGSAFHMKSEIAGAIAHIQEAFPDVHVNYSTPLGFHIKLAELMQVRVQEALDSTPGTLPPEKTAVLVVGSGCSDPDSNSSTSKAARVLFEKGGYQMIEVAYERVTRPTTEEGIAKLHQLGAKQVVVIPYLLFTGIVHQKIRASTNQKAEELGLKLIHAGTLGTHPLLLEVAEQRLREAEDGTSDMLRHKMVEGFELVSEGEHHHHHDHGHHHHHGHDHDHSHQGRH
jgi:sirohydrochlorin cobaltochelatase